ncbi:MAG TPA: alpha-hydroxy-acid oxidizing protein [Puia sp.]|nr:alpha-hydroxy-acid oxidizing protein [Puia sp.]
MTSLRAIERQRAIYTEGLSGQRSRIPFHAQTLRDQAKQKMSAKAWAYIDGGAGNEETIGRNASAFSALAIRPHMMRPNESAHFSTSLLGLNLDFPVLLAPIGALDLICAGADRIVARACHDTGTPFIFSNQAGTPMEACAKEMGDTPRWFQLYLSRSDELVLSLVRRAEACGCSAIVLTVDTTLLGWRSRDLTLAYLPFLRGMGIAQYTSDPVFRDLLKKGEGQPSTGAPRPKVNLTTIANVLRLKARYPGGFWKNLRSPEPLAAVRLFTGIYSNPALSWERVSRLREQTRLPILIKGILRADDALQAAASGASGIIVSNHGGRQVDGARATPDALQEIRKVLPKPFPVLLDSGIRSGSDCFKAIAMGADAVLLGRPYAYGLAIARQQGVCEVILNLLSDFELTARLAGCRNLSEINEDMIITNH